jgi:hypothetical protein
MKIKLEQWPVAIGTLVDTNGTPVGGMQVFAEPPYTPYPGDEQYLAFQSDCTTDAQGRFRLAGLPSGRRFFICRWAGGSVAWAQTQTWFDAHSGTNDLGKVVLDTPPPVPLLEQIKAKLGLGL